MFYISGYRNEVTRICICDDSFYQNNKSLVNDYNTFINIFTGTLSDSKVKLIAFTEKCDIEPINITQEVNNGMCYTLRLRCKCKNIHCTNSADKLPVRNIINICNIKSFPNGTKVYLLQTELRTILLINEHPIKIGMYEL